MTAEKESFAARWSRLKRERADEAGEPSSPPPAERAGEAEPPVGEPAEAPAVEELPDPDSLPPDADFSVFMRDNVPELLRRRALRRLWRSNPIIASVDMLDDYCEDFTDAATVVPALRTAYRLGKGMLEKLEEAAPEEEARPAVATRGTASTGTADAAAAAGRPPEKERGDGA